MRKAMTLKDKVKQFLQFKTGRYAVEEFPLKEWDVSANNLATRLSEYALERPQWIEGTYRPGKQYKEWGYVWAEESGQVVMAGMMRPGAQ